MAAAITWSTTPGTRLNKEYGYAYANYRKMASRKPMNTEKWTFIPAETLVRKIENAPRV